jgi:hypothetical protein
MKQTTKKVLKIVISIVYIIWGILSPLTLIRSIIALSLPAIVAAAVGVLTLLAGIFGLIGIKKVKCRIFGIVIFIFSLVSVVLALPAISVNSIITAILAWLFIACL